MGNVFVFIDKTQRKIYLSNERYKHILKHPEMRDKLEEIRNTLENPSQITHHPSKKHIFYYHTYHKNRKSPAKYLRVIVKYLNGKGFIITAYYIEKIQ